MLVGEDREAKRCGQPLVVDEACAAPEIEGEWAQLIGVHQLRELRDHLELLHDRLWPPDAGPSPRTRFAPLAAETRRDRAARATAQRGSGRHAPHRQPR